ncbi:MAG: RnfABCDGE type electron transport complex subunit B [Bacillota bacterium]|jgi:Na+-translocating ferredoxin:NAD+ oxidoreductase RNF subunit RnfB|nr:RnfABCDGE type electron transport complex subunit B [Bacillota bacterium]HOB90420.1 RnfABCDGE type electron transport complex subunit B [Bacillota bacterium]HPZ53840.1 RnfABCDGE type electron transport complex subunit B [Bacillota bacterium]HQD17349.1 RnfABCDGE type electron transport complex subunit B [Bacillota bacterium]
MSVGAVVSLGVIGVVLGIALAVAARKLAVEVDPREAEINEVLPGANCGACGHPGCSGYAAAVVAGTAGVDKCPVGGNTVAARIAEIMGLDVKGISSIRKIAKVRCQGDKDACPDRFEYDGVADCRAAVLVGGGHKACEYGCLGLGTCAAACPFDAIHMSEQGLPVIDPEKCLSCGKCVEACPRGLIELLDEDIAVFVACCSTAKGAEVRRTCKLGCIGCGICAKNCPADAIEVTDFLARIDQSKCTRCGICAEKCPTNCIVVDDRYVRIVDQDTQGIAAASE